MSEWVAEDEVAGLREELSAAEAVEPRRDEVDQRHGTDLAGLRQSLLAVGVVGANVRALRGMTQDDLSAESGLSKVAISRLENGKRRPRWSTARALAKALDVEPHVLLPDEGEPTPADVLADYVSLGG